MLLLNFSCINDDDFIQEGVLKITFSQTTQIKNDTKVVVDVMDITDKEHVIFTKESVSSTYFESPVPVPIQMLSLFFTILKMTFPASPPSSALEE